MKTRIEYVGDNGILVIFGEQIDAEINQRAHCLSTLLEASPEQGMVEVIPGYATLLVVYDPLEAHLSLLVDRIRKELEAIHATEARPAKRVEVPTVYGGERGVDLDFVAQFTGLAKEQVIHIHSRAEYRVFMMGFSPGFPYLGGMDVAIAVPRLETPRQLVRSGSVGIAGTQTGIYTVDSPGGWRLIGYTPLRLFDIQAAEPFLVKPGDRLRFVPIEEGEIRDGD